MSRKLIYKLFLLLCLLLLRRLANSQEQKPTETSEHRTGIVRSVDLNKWSIAIRTKSRTHPDEETVHTFQLGPDTKVSKMDGTAVKLSDLKEGSVVEWSGKKVDGESKVNAIVLQQACTPDKCARSNCNRTCRSESCKCPRI
jgi:Cu/Ag efflux protein CusF